MGLMPCSFALPCRQELCSFWILLFLRSYIVQAFKYFLDLHKWCIYVLKWCCFPKEKKNRPKTVAVERFCKAKVAHGGLVFLLHLCQPVLSVGWSKLPHKLGHFPDLWPLVHSRFAFQIWCNVNLMTLRKIPRVYFFVLIKITGVPQSNNKIRWEQLTEKFTQLIDLCYHSSGFTVIPSLNKKTKCNVILIWS